MTFNNDQIDIDSLPDFEQTKMIPVEKRYYTVLLINHTIVYVFLYALLFTMHSFATDRMWIKLFPWLFVGVTIGVLVHFLVVRLGFNHRKYGLRERDISYAHGWLIFHHYTLPFVRTQHVEIKQGPIAKYFKLANLKVFTAGDGDDVNIKGLSVESAEEIRAFIISKINGDV
ncbi:PH domain-containing protein [Flavobacteriaceae bacterium F08102]|nr:PH domain-containing protein [Flavobacteriaceae bacterium F08102]